MTALLDAPSSKMDLLSIAVERLGQAFGNAISGRDCQWIEQVNVAVVAVGKGLRNHMKLAGLPDGLFAEVDTTRPTLARQVMGLCSDHYDLLVSTVFLHDEIQHALEVIRTGIGRNGDAVAVAMPNLEAINQRGERLVANLRQVQDAETNLILESLNTDLGVGD